MSDLGPVPPEVEAALGRVREEASMSCAYFHTWWSLANLAYPDFPATMNDDEHVDFFHACIAGFLSMTFVSLGKLLDRDDRALSLGKLRTILREHGFPDVAKSIEAALSGQEEVAKRVIAIRNRTISHNELSTTRDDVFDQYGTTPNEIRALVEAVRTTLNQAGSQLGWPIDISAGERSERATMALLRRLRAGIEHEAEG